MITACTGNSDRQSPDCTPAGDLAKPAADSAFSLPPSRAQPTSAADNLLPVPAARSRDEDRSTKPRIWSLVEVATRSDYRPKRADHVVSAAEFRHSAEFRPWRANEAATWEPAAAARLLARQSAVVSPNILSTTPFTRWQQNIAGNGVTAHVTD